jgi:hypothetical protein
MKVLHLAIGVSQGSEEVQAADISEACVSGMEH